MTCTWHVSPDSGRPCRNRQGGNYKMAGSHGLQLDPIATSEHHSTHARHCDAAVSPVPPFKNVSAPSIDREGLVVAAPARVAELTRDDVWVVVADFAVKCGGAAAAACGASADGGVSGGAAAAATAVAASCPLAGWLIAA